MKKLIAGLAIGLIVGAVLPVQAHHRDGNLRAQLDTLRSRVRSLELSSQNTSSSVSSLNSRVSTTESNIRTLQSTTSSLSSRLYTVEGRTRRLDSSGNYTGTIDGGDIDVPFGCGGDLAVWSYFGLDC